MRPGSTVASFPGVPSARTADAAIAQRTRFVAGSFFDALPGPVDVVVLNRLLQDWHDDDAAIRILSRSRAALCPAGRVLVVERIVARRADEHSNHDGDVRMPGLSPCGARACARSLWDFDRLFATAGLKQRHALATAAGLTIIDAAPF